MSLFTFLTSKEEEQLDERIEAEEKTSVEEGKEYADKIKDPAVGEPERIRYAEALTRSIDKSQVEYGIRILIDIEKSASKEEQLWETCRYFVILALYRRMDFTTARKLAEDLVKHRDSKQYRDLLTAVEHKVAKEGRKGLLMVAGAAGVAIGSMLFLAKRLGKK